MKEKILFLSVFILFFSLSWNCRHKIKIIPEITPHITEEIVYDFGDKETVKKILVHDNKLIFVTLKGEILRLDPETKTLDTPANFKIDIDPDIFTQNNFIVLKQENENAYIIYNLNGAGPEKKIDNIDNDKIIGIEDDFLVYRKKDTLFFFDYHNGNIKKELELAADVKLYNSESSGDAIIVLSDTSLYIYNKTKNSIETREMRDLPASGFLLDSGYIYYGSENWELVKFSLQSKKVSWKFKLPVILKLKPQKTDRHIVITPEDNNIYFFNKKGSLRWWTSFDSIRVLPAVVMKKNAAVFLMNREYRRMNNNIRFFNFKKKEVVSFESGYQLESNPVFLNGYLYIVCKNEEKRIKFVSKIGNRRDTELEIKPEKVKPRGKSLTFIIKPINLIEPEVRVNILDKSQNSVYVKEISKNQSLTFVWIPEIAADYKCIVEVNAENIKNLKIEEEFTVVDIDKIVREYYSELFKKYPNVLPEEKKKEKIEQTGKEAAAEPEKSEKKIKEEKKEETEIKRDKNKNGEIGQPAKKKKTNKKKNVAKKKTGKTKKKKKDKTRIPE